MNYNDLLKQAIKESGYKLDEISAMLEEKGLTATKQYLSRLQNGKNPPASDKLNKALSDILKIDYKRLSLMAHIQKSPKEIKDIISNDNILEFEKVIKQDKLIEDWILELNNSSAKKKMIMKGIWDSIKNHI